MFLKFSRRMKFLGIFVLLLFIFMLSAPAQASNTTYYVADTSGNDSNNGTSANAAFKTISKAIETAVSGDTIIVASGDYKLTQTLTVTKSITLKSSGAVTLDGQNDRRVIAITGSTSSNLTVTIEGFTIKNGKTKTADGHGSGICLWNGGATVTNCVFENNTADGACGGGMYVGNSETKDVTIKDCTFINNTAYTRGGGLDISCGVAKSDGSYSTATITNCTFINNKLTSDVEINDNGGNGLYIGNANNNSNNMPTVTNCTFVNTNEDTHNFKEIYADKNCTITNSLIWATNAVKTYVPGEQDIGTSAATVNLDHCAVKDSSAFNTYVINKDNSCVTLTSVGSQSSGTNGQVTHTVYQDYDALKSLMGKGKYDAIVTVDQLGKTRANPPSIGAVEIAGSHEHSYTYSANGATITAACNGAGTCTLTDKKATLTINAPANLEYDGTAKNATISGTIPGVNNPSIVYSPSSPINAGDYTASITLGNATASVSFTITVKESSNIIDLHFINDPITITVEQAGYNEKMFISRVDYACDYIYGNGNKASLAPNWSIEDAPSWLAVNEGVLVADLRKVNVEPGEYAATLRATANYMGVTATATAKVKVTVTGYTELEVTAPDSVMVVYAGFSESRLDLKPLITVRGLHSVRGWETVTYSSREIAQSGNWPSWLTIEDFVAVGKAPAGTAPGNYEYEYEVTVNKDNMFGTGKCRLTVYVTDKSELEPAKIVMDSDALPYAQEGIPYSAKIYATGDAPIKWTVDTNTPLPDGLTLNENTGEISGTPTAKNAGQIKGFLIYVSNPANASNPDQRYFIIAVQGVPPSDWKITRNPVKVSKGETFEVTFRVTKGRSVYYNTVEYPDKTYLKKVIAQNASEAGEGYIKYTLVWPEKKEQKYKFQVKATNKYGWSNKSKAVTVRSTGKIASVGDDIDYGFITIAEDDDEYEDSGTYANGYTTDNIETESGVTYFTDGGSDSDGNITGVIGGTSSYKTLDAFIASLGTGDLAKVIRLEFRKGAEVTSITAEDLEKFTGLTELAVDESEKLAGINLNGNKTLQSVTVFDCPALEKIYAESCTALVLLGASKCPKLADINVDGCQSLETLWLDGSAVTKLDLSGSEFANVSNIDVAGCTSLDVLNVDGCKALSDLYAPYTAVTELNLSNNPKLKSLSLVGAVNLTELKLADGVQLENFDLTESKITSLSYTGNEKITSLDFSSNKSLKNLNLTNCTNLRVLNISGTTIETLTLTGCYSLETLKAENCEKLSALNLDDCANMKEIYLNGSGIETLDVGACGKLEILDVLVCTALTSLNAKGCSLTNLSLIGCKKLAELDCSNNSLGYLNLDDLTALSNVNYSGQKIYGWTPDTKMKLSDYIGGNDIGRVADILAYGANEIGIEATIEDENGNVYNADTEYYAVFEAVPEKVVYYYDTHFSGGELMDVTLTGESSPSEMGSSGGGCVSVRSEALRVRSVLMFLMIAIAFPKLKSKK